MTNEPVLVVFRGPDVNTRWFTTKGGSKECTVNSKIFQKDMIRHLVLLVFEIYKCFI